MSIVSVHVARWTFSDNVNSVTAAAGFKQNGGVGVSAVVHAPNAIDVTYAGTVASDNPWTLDTTTVVIAFASGDSLAPGQTGSVL